MKSTHQPYHALRRAFAGATVLAFLFTGCSGEINNQEADGAAVMEEGNETAGTDPETTDNAATQPAAGSSTGTKFTYVQPKNLAGDEKKMLIDARTTGFKQLDTDNDQVVEKDEFYDGLFAAVDANEDNILMAGELDREVDFWNKNGNPALDSFAEWDTDMNGNLSRPEFRNKLASVIDVPNGETLAQNLYVVWDLDNDDRIELLELENVAIRFDADHN